MMVDEYLSEREQAEQLKRWLRENWIWLLAGVALALGGYHGWRWWESRQDARSVEAEQRFAAMLEALGRDGREEGVKIGNELTGKFADTPYADHALLVLARVDVDAGDLASAARRLSEVARASNDPDLRVVAGLRLARVQLALGRYDDALATLDGFTQPAVRARVEEIRGDVKLAQGDKAAALAAWKRAQAAAAASPESGGGVDADFLQLKMDRLAAPPAAAGGAGS
jgi:predicted negative regulator of RcsB-dependent stress response